MRRDRENVDFQVIAFYFSIKRREGVLCVAINEGCVRLPPEDI